VGNPHISTLAETGAEIVLTFWSTPMIIVSYHAKWNIVFQLNLN
jgi:hypothetical protein